jgi:purine-binding chemotaxis protein CheW
MLTFHAAGERFAVPAGIVREVARLPRLTRVPHAPASLLGLGNFRGVVLPVVSFARLTGRVAGRERRAILLDAANPIALAVEDVASFGNETDADAIDIDALAARDYRKGGRTARATGKIAEANALPVRNEIALVAFSIAGQDYALPVAAVQDVLRLPAEIAQLPHADAMVIGSIAVRDALLPLLSLQALLGLKGEDDHARPRVVVVKIGAHRVGLVVDRMRSILRVPEAQIDPVPAVLVRGAAEARIQAICRLDGGRRLVSVLAVEHLVREELTAQLMRDTEHHAAEPARAEAAERLLLFQIGDARLALPIEAVAEVVRLPARLARLPNAPAFVRGVMNLRGQAIPVIDQAQRFGGEAATGARARVIVIRIGALQAGFVVDAVSDVVRVPASLVRPAPDLGGEETRVFDRVADVEQSGETLLIVNPQELLDGAERDTLAALAT